MKLTLIGETCDHTIFLTNEEFDLVEKLIKPYDGRIIIFSPVVSSKDVESGMLKRIKYGEYFKNLYDFFNKHECSDEPPFVFSSSNYIIIADEVKKDDKKVKSIKIEF
jgi:hypothetical protein